MSDMADSLMEGGELLIACRRGVIKQIKHDRKQHDNYKEKILTEKASKVPQKSLGVTNGIAASRRRSRSQNTKTQSTIINHPI